MIGEDEYKKAVEHLKKGATSRSSSHGMLDLKPLAYLNPEPRSFWTREVPDTIGWIFLASILGFVGTMDSLNLAPFLIIGILGLLIWLGLVGLGGVTVKSFLIYGVGAAPVIFGLSLLFIISRTEIPEEVRSDQVLVEITAEEMQLYDVMVRLDADGFPTYAEISSRQNAINEMSRRADAIWSSIPEGTVITRNKVPVGAYADLVELRDEARVRQGSLDRHKREIALQRSALLDDPEIAGLLAEHETLIIENEILTEKIDTFKATPTGRFRSFAQIFLIILAVFVGLFLFFAIYMQ